MRKMNKKFEITLLIIVALLAFLGTVYSAFALNIEEPKYYSYTVAVCSGKKCADFYVECNGNKIISNSRITGWITFGDDWEDPRGENKKDFCN